MAEPCQNWFSDLEIQDGDDVFNQHHKMNSSLDDIDGDQIFREIMHQPAAFSYNDTTHHPPLINQNKDKRGSSNFIFSSPPQHASEKPVATTSPVWTCILTSFGDSTAVAAGRQTWIGKQPLLEDHVGGGYRARLPSKGVADKHEFQLRAKQTMITKTGRRSSTETLDHIMAERRRRRELTERFIALSATIPGLKKIDKVTILEEAITHVKRLQERVRELEEQSKKTNVKSVSFIWKSHFATDKGGTTTSGTAIMNSDYCFHRTNETLPTVEARVFKRDILLWIHCKIESGVLLKILAHLETLDLSTTSNSVMPFGNSTLDISIVAQMGDKFNVTMNDLVKNLRLALLESSG